MNKLTIIIVHIFLLSFSCCFAQETAQFSEEELYKRAEQGLSFYNDGNYTQACRLLKIVAESGQLDKPSLGMISYYLCDCYYEVLDSLKDGTLEKYETARECYQWMLKIDWKQFKELNPTDVRTNVLTAYVIAIHSYSTSLANIDQAIKLEKEAMELYNGISNSDLNMGVIKAHLHELYMDKMQWDDAIAMAKDAEKIVFDNGGKIGDLVRLYSNLAMIYNQKAEIQTSGAYANRVLTCMKELNEDDLNYDERVSYSMALYYLAISYQQIAKPVYYDYFKRAYNLIKSNDDIRNERYFRELLLQLVATSRSLNERDYTTKFLEELWNLCVKYESPLGRIYNETRAYYIESITDKGEREQALKMSEEFITSWQENHIFDNTEASDFQEWPQDDRVGTFMHVLSVLIYDFTDEVFGSPEQLRTLQSFLNNYSANNKEAYSLLSFLSFKQGDYKSCIAYGQQSLENDVKDMGRDMLTLQLMVHSARNLKQYNQLDIYNQILFARDKIMLKRIFKNVTSEVRSNYWAQAESNFSTTISNALVCNTSKSMELAYDASLCRKGILLSTDMELAKVIAESRDTCLQRMYSDLQIIHAARNEYALKGNDRIARYLATESDVLENEVIHKAQQYKNFDRMFDFGWKDINRKLSNTEAAVEFEMYMDEEDRMQYVALVMTKGHIYKVDLFDEEKLLSLVNGNVYNNSSLAQHLWTPILRVATDVKKLYFAPCGLLYNVAIESLPTSRGLIANDITLVRLSSTRELLRSVRNKKQASEAALYGGLQYSMDTDEMVALADASSRQRGSLATIAPLPGTLEEVKSIAATLQQSKISPRVLSEKAGTEQSIKALSGNALRTLHIATHGFYNDITTKDKSYLAELSTLQRGINEEDITLTRSGLLFAGADNIIQGEEIPQGVDDGILTAQEISTLNLSDVELVTLSACDTGLGDITGDGVFGLQRGFKKAGANSILMSLWKVDDEATCKLMTEFYSNWIGKKMTKHDALEAAKTSVRTDKEHPQWQDPMYWAAFILLDGLD